MSSSQLESKPQAEPQLLSISVVCYDTPESELLSTVSSVVAALRELGDHSSNTGYTLTLVDNSESGSLSLLPFSALEAELAAVACELRLIQGHGNIGYGSGQNLAFDASRARFHLFMNPDVELAADSLAIGYAFLAENPDVAMISPQAFDESGNRQFLCKRYPTVFDFFLRGFMPASVQRLFGNRLSRFEMRELSDAEPSKEAPIISGCFMFCRSEVFEQVSGFDPAYFLYFEDFDLSLRIGKHAALAYVPAMRIKHGGGGSARKGLKHIKMFVQSGRRFFSRHGWRWFKQL